MDNMGPGYVYPVRIPLPEGQTLVFHFFTPHFGDNRAGLRVHQYIMHADSPREYLTTPDLRRDDLLFAALHSFDLGPQRLRVSGSAEGRQ